MEQFIMNTRIYMAGTPDDDVLQLSIHKEQRSLFHP